MSRNSYKGIDEGIVKMGRKMAAMAVGAAGIRKEDIPDIEQELMVSVLKGMNKYDAKKSGLLGYAKLLMTNRLRRLIRMRTCPSAGTRYTRVSLNMELIVQGEIFELIEFVNRDGLLEEMHARPDNTAIDVIERRLDVETLVNRMPSELREACEKLQAEEPFSAKAHGILSLVSFRKIQAIRNILKDYET